MTLLPTDNNGHAIQAMAPREASNHDLSATAAEVVAADAKKTRIVRLFPTEAGAKVGFNPSPAMFLTEGIGEYFEIEAGSTLYASGSGILNITVMG